MTAIGTIPNSRPYSILITPGDLTSLNFHESKKRIPEMVELALERSVDLIQVREKSLPARLLAEISAELVEACNGTEIGVLVNDRVDVALAVGALGVHLTAESMRPEVVRAMCNDSFVVGCSTHSLEEANSARNSGADYVFFGPVFDTPSKRKFGKPQGLTALSDVAKSLVGFPVVAVGGVNETNIHLVLDAGAAGFAAIRWYQG